MRTLYFSLTLAAAALVGTMFMPSSAKAQTSNNYTRPKFQPTTDPRYPLTPYNVENYYWPTPGAPVGPNGMSHFYGDAWWNGGYFNGYSSDRYYLPRNYYNNRQWR